MNVLAFLANYWQMLVIAVLLFVIIMPDRVIFRRTQEQRNDPTYVKRL